MDQFCFGVDLGGTTVKIGLFTVDGMLQEKWEIPTRTENQGAAILSDIAASIQNKVDVRHLTKEQVTGIGIGVPGPVLNENRVQGCVNLGWGNVCVADRIISIDRNEGQSCERCQCSSPWRTVAGRRQRLSEYCDVHTGNGCRRRHYPEWTDCIRRQWCSR